MKQRAHFALNNEELEYIKKIKNQNSFPSMSIALEKIIREHQSAEQLQGTFLIDGIAQAVADKMKNLQYGVNSVDKNSEIILLLLNQLLIYSNVKLYSDMKSPQLIFATQSVSDKIKSARTKKLNNIKKESYNFKKVKNDFLKKETAEEDEYDYIDEEFLNE